MRCMEGVDVSWYFSSAWYLEWMPLPLYVLSIWLVPQPEDMTLTVEILFSPNYYFSFDKENIAPTNTWLPQQWLWYRIGSSQVFEVYVIITSVETKGFTTWLHIALAEECSAYLVFDFIIFLLTISQTLRFRKELGNIRSITSIFLRDGMCRFPLGMSYSQPITRISVFCVCSYFTSRQQGYWWNFRVICIVDVANVTTLLVSSLCHIPSLSTCGTYHIQYRRYQWVMRSLQEPWNVVHVTPLLLECKQSPPCLFY